MESREAGRYRRFGKPMMDFLLCLFCFPFFLILLIVVVVVNKPSRMPVFFVHQRPGHDQELFGVYKFCTIHPKTGEINGFSTFLRKSSLDELPQVINVLKREMSWVGPRPLLVEYIAQYHAEHHMRHEVKPGVTGLAQVSGRNRLDLTSKLDLDVRYVETLSFRNDLKILFGTLVQIVRLDEADGHVMLERKGW